MLIEFYEEIVCFMYLVIRHFHMSKKLNIEMVEEALEMLTEKPEEGQHALICE